MTEITALSPRTGWLHSLDPRSKMLLCAAGIGLVLAADLAALIPLLCLSAALLLSSRVSVRRLLDIGLSLRPLVAVVLVTWPLFYSRGEDVWFAWTIIRITRDGVLGGVTTAVRILALVYTIALLAGTTDQARMVRALVKLGLPYAWGLTISMALRYIPALYGLYLSVSEAQQARAWSVPAGNVVRRAQGYLPVLIAVLIGAIRLSEQTALALTARGFDPDRPRVYYREVRFAAGDVLVVAAALVLAVLFAAWQTGVVRPP